MDIPTNEPFQLRAGDTWKWRREDLGDYPAPIWTLTYYFKKADANFSIVATADGTNHAVTVAKATTAAYSPGTYDWSAVVDNGTERYEIDKGELEVLRDFAAAGNFDSRTHVEKTLEAIEAVIANRATKDQEEYQIGNRMLKRTPIADLVKLRSQYRSELANMKAAEKMAAGLATGSKIQVRL